MPPMRISTRRYFHAGQRRESQQSKQRAHGSLCLRAAIAVIAHGFVVVNEHTPCFFRIELMHQSQVAVSLGGMCYGVGSGRCRDVQRQPEEKPQLYNLLGIVFQAHPAPVRFDDAAAQVQPHAHAFALGGKGRLQTGDRAPRGRRNGVLHESDHRALLYLARGTNIAAPRCAGGKRVRWQWLWRRFSSSDQRISARTRWHRQRQRQMATQRQCSRCSKVSDAGLVCRLLTISAKIRELAAGFAVRETRGCAG